MRKAVVLSGIVVFALAGAASAAVDLWRTGAVGNWDVAGNWTTGVVPASGDSARIGSGTATANTDLGLVNVQVDAGAMLKISNALAASETITLNGGTAYLNRYNVTYLPAIQLMANSTIATNVNYSNYSETLGGSITELSQGLKLTYDGQPHLSGPYIDNIVPAGTNTYTGGTDVYGPRVNVNNASALGSGPVNIYSGYVQINTAGPYNFGTITTRGTYTSPGSTTPWGPGVLQISGSVNPTYLTVDLQGGALVSSGSQSGTARIDSTNNITISGTAGILGYGSSLNNVFTINTTITGSGKPILNDWGTPAWNSSTSKWITPNTSHLAVSAAQAWTGGTDVRGLVDLNAGGSLPAGTVTVYGMDNSLYGGGELRLLNTASNGGLSTSTDLVLVDQTYTSGSNTLTAYATLRLGTNVTVHSLTLNGTVLPAGKYVATGGTAAGATVLPNNLYSSSTAYSLTVLTPRPGPTTVTDLAASDLHLTSITLTWSAPSDSMDPGNTAISYDVRYSTESITDATFATATPVTQSMTPKAPGATETLVVTGLTPGTPYCFAVKSVNNGDVASDLSNVVSAATLVEDVTPPADVSDLSAINVDTRKLTLTWTASGNDGTVGTATRYDIRMSTRSIDDSNFDAAQVVPQTLTPKPAGQTETLPVSGLTPGTTYYFAMKVADNPAATVSGLPNWSGLSNVLQQATLPPDVTAPAAVTDLTASGTDAFSADLTWTASGDDGLAGAATRYEIRYSTSPINEANWTAAFMAFNSIVPQPSGSTEHYTVTALQPSTTYYFAIKVFDEENNVSGLSNVASLTTAALPDLPLVTSVTIVEKAGATSTNYPLTLSMVFKQGDVQNNVIARVAGQALATQNDVKVRYADGSVKHSLVSFLLPSLPANGQVSVDFLAGGPSLNSHPITAADLLARDFDAQLTITIGGVPTTISARQMLQNMATPTTWICGDICSEFLIRDLSTSINNQLNVQYCVRVYNGYGGIRVDTVVENCWTQYRGNVTYDLSLSLGQASPQIVFTKTALTHNFNARWHKVFWQGTTPATIQVKYDLPYRISTGLIPRYDTSVIMDAATMTSRYASWQKSAHDIMDSGIFQTYFPTTGGREDIGLYPTWCARYLLSMDNRMREITLNCGDLSGSIPIHLRESDPARSFHDHVISIDDRPTVWVGWWNYSSQKPGDMLPAPVGDTTTVWTVDGAHQASFAYIPYLFSGDYYYLEEMYFWAGWDLANSNWSYRNSSAGWLVEQTRGLAWMVRNLADAANMAPDGDIEKAYFISKLNNNLTHWVSTYVNSPNYPANHYWENQSNYGADGGRPDSSLVANCRYYTSPWMDDFCTAALGHLRDIGFDTSALLDWFGDSLVKRFSSPGYNPFRGSPYHIPVQYDDGTGHGAPYATWADINNAFVDPIGPSSFPSTDYAGSYNFIARGAMTWVVHLTSGWSTWNWLNSNLHTPPQSSFAVDPTWAIVPPTRVPGDIDFDGHTNLADLKLLVGAWNSSGASPNWNGNADLDGDGNVNLADLKILVANWNK